MATTQQLARRLTRQMQDACPCLPSVGTFADKLTWAVNPLAGATAPQIAAAQAVIDGFDTGDAAQAAWENTDQRTAASAAVTDTNTPGKVYRGIAAVLVDEINILRQWLASFKTEVAAATSLADLKTRVATLPATPDRTLAQAKTAVQNAIAAGTAD